MHAERARLAELLWEAATVEPRVDRIRELTFGAASDVPASAASALPVEPGDVVKWADDHGLVALLWRALRLADCLDWLGEWRDELAHRAETARHEGLLLVPLALETALRPLRAVGLDPVLFKGPALAARYPEPGLRPMSDLDLILPADQHLRAVRALESGGWTVVRPAGARHHETALTHPDIPRLYVELHRALDVWYERSTSVRAENLWRRRTPSECLGIRVAALPAEEELVALASHAGKPHHTFGRLIWITDLVVAPQSAAAACRPIDWDRVASLARSWHCQTVTAVALTQARRLGLDVPEECTRISASKVRRSALAPLLGPEWPLAVEDESLRLGLRFALVDRWPRRLAMFIGSPAPAPAREWPHELARHGTSALRRAWRTWRSSELTGQVMPFYSLRRMSWRERATVAHLGLLLALAEVAVRLAPLPTVSRRFGAPLATHPSTVRTGDPWARLTPAERHRLHLLDRLADAWPLQPGPCLRTALVQGRLLRRQCPTLRVGVAGTGSRVTAHAWIEIDGHSLDPHAGFLPLERAHDRAS